MNKNILAGCILMFFAACGNTTAPQNATMKYFDVKGYFEQEATRLNQTKPLVHKTVKVNEATENKKIRIADWNKELANFIDADINKNAWQGSFKIAKTPDQDVYTSDDDKILVKKLKISRENDKITAIEILLNTSNYLYHSTDTLIYLPERSYEIKKTQQIKLLNPKRYEIKGTF
jgi:hypothetical protein